MDRNLRIRMLLEAGDKITRPMRDAAAGSSRLAQSLRATRESLTSIKRAQSDIAGFRELKAGLATTSQKLTEARTKATELGRALAQTENPTRKMRAEFNRAKQEAAQLIATHQRQHGELQELRGRLNAAGVATRDLAGHERRLRTEAAQTNETLRDQQRRLQEVTDRSRRLSAARDQFGKVQGTATGLAAGGAAAIGTGMAVGGPVVAAAKGAMALEESMADVGKITNMTEPVLKAMSRDFMDMSEEIPKTATELAGIAASGAAAGVGMDKFGKPLRDQRQQLLEFTRDAGEMGVAFDMLPEAAGETMSKWRTAFGLPQEGVRALGDQVNALTNRFGGTASNVTDIITRIGPLGKVAGLASSSIAALGSTLDSIGIPSEVAATGIKNTMLALTKGQAATKQQVAAYEQLGLKAPDVAKRMQKDAAGTIIDVMERIGKLNPDQQAGMLTRLFGSESVAAIAPMLTNLDALKARLQLVGNSSEYAGSMHQEFVNRANTAAGKAQMAANGIDNLKTAMGDGLLPSIKEGSQWILGITKGMRKWLDAHPGLARAIGLTTGVVAGLFLILGGGAIVLAGLVAPFAALTAAATFLGIGLLPLIGIAAGIVVGIGLLAAGAYLLYKNWGTISAWFGGLWDEITGYFSGGIGGIGALLFNFSPLGLMYAGFAKLLSWLGIDIPNRMTGAGRAMIEGLVKGITGALGWLKDAVSNAATSAANWFKEKLGIHSPSRVFAQFGNFMMQGLDVGIADGAESTVGRINRIAGDISRAMVAGASIPVLAATPAGASTGAGGAPPSIGPISITIHQQPGQDSHELARLVEEALRNIQRRDAAAARSSFDDEGDYGAFV